MEPETKEMPQAMMITGQEVREIMGHIPAEDKNDDYDDEYVESDTEPDTDTECGTFATP